ncbi:hypothetical protein BGZ93_004813 [Podila epicladia]|nr:hypothetical protein BGZ92_008579 [Podila epicladia]KAG0096253.1 hypothetical protein BGZ93_004813 [Podila epicladia]
MWTIGDSPNYNNLASCINVCLHLDLQYQVSISCDEAFPKEADYPETPEPMTQSLEIVNDSEEIL